MISCDKIALSPLSLSQKRMICLRYLALLALVVLLSFYANFTDEPVTEIDVAIDGEKLVLDKPVKMFEGTIYVPVASIYEKLGVEINWREDEQTLYGSIGNFELELPAGSKEVIIDGTQEEWESPVKYFNESIYAPFEPTIKALGPFVEWDYTTGTVSISTPDTFDPKDPDPDREGPLLHVAYPSYSPFYYYDTSLFVFGTTRSYARVNITVNGEPVQRYDPRTGNFLTMVEIPQGEEHTIEVKATYLEGSTSVERTVIYPDWWEAMPWNPLDIHSSRLIPSENQVLSPGDNLQVAVQGSPGAEAYFQIGYESSLIPMTELEYPTGLPGNGGIYGGTYEVGWNDVPASGQTRLLPIIVTLYRDGNQVSREMPGQVSLTSDFPYKIVEVKDRADLNWRGWLRLIDESYYDLLSDTRGGTGYPSSVTGYLWEGSRFEVFGSSGNYYRTRINGSTYLISKGAVEVVESVDALASNVSTARVKESRDKITVQLDTTERAPIKVEDGTNNLSITLHNTKVDDTYSKPVLPKTVTELSLTDQNNANTAVLSVELGLNMIGFDCTWEGSDLVLEIYKPPTIDPEQPLKNKVIVIDPGHGGEDTGAPGPGHYHEKDSALAMSLYLEEFLSEAGADVYLTRDEDIFVDLYERTDWMVDHGADFFISVHSNAHAHGADAVNTHGLMTLYNYDHNEELAEIMLDTMEEVMDLPAVRTWRRNIAVLRHTQVPSVLVEAGYMMHPEDNWYILHPEGQKKFARSMKEGIENYFLALAEKEHE